MQEDPKAGARWAPAMRALGDERLARMVESGSDSAFAAIYGRYAPVLHGYCRSLLRDEEEAGDALQNAMLKALQAMRRAGRSGPLRPWLFRIAHNESVTIIRQRARRPAPLEESMIAGAGDAFRRAAAREQLAALLADMQNLTEHQRGALVMRELGGLTYDEIGSALDTTPLAARQAVFVARRRLDDGPAGTGRPRRLRPALQLLIGPAPAGLVFLGAMGGGAGAGAKALVATAAAVSIGVGSVELVVRGAPEPKRQVARAESAPRVTPERAAPRASTTPVATASATPSPSSPSPVPAPRTAAPATGATVRFVETSVKEEPAPAGRRDRPEPEAADPPQPEPQPVQADGDDHRVRPGRHREPAPAPSAPAPVPMATPTPTATATAAPQHHGYGGYASRGAGGRPDCPPGDDAEAAATAAPVVPVQ